MVQIVSGEIKAGVPLTGVACLKVMWIGHMHGQNIMGGLITGPTRYF